MQSKKLTYGLLMAAIAVFAPAAQAANTYTNAGDWTNDANWSLGHVPVDAEDVIINANVVLTNSPANLASCILYTNKTLTFVGWNTVLTATVVNVYGTLIHTNNTDTATNAPWTPNSRIWIVCTNLMVATNGWIKADGKGYACGPTNSGYAGYGPGGSTRNSCSAGYGGVGQGEVGQPPGPVKGAGATYGAADAPIDPGSGGSSGQGGKGGTGGGAIRIQAKVVNVNGMITANATKGTDPGGGGSGGGIYITCDSISGTNGLVAADGSQSSQAGGAGGRIAVIYNPTLQRALPAPAIRFSAASKPSRVTTDFTIADPGTLYFPDFRFLEATNFITHTGQWLTPNVTNWIADSVTFSNNWLRFPMSGLRMTVSNSITIIGSNVDYTKIELTNAAVSCGGNMMIMSAGAFAMYGGSTSSNSLNCGGNLVLTNGSLFTIYSGGTNAATMNYGALVSVAGNVNIASNCWIYPYSEPTNGGSVYFQMENLTIDTNAGFNANGKGYATLLSSPGSSGYGPGGGKRGNLLSGNWRGGGGGYGGYGGMYTNISGTKYGWTYGSSNAPMDPGSGGGSRNLTTDAWEFGTLGGGLVRINARGTITLNGSISASGLDATKYTCYAGGGSGGGIYLICRRFAGSGGSLSANGGNMVINSGGGSGGGGGRIAVWYNTLSANAVTSNVAGGISGSAGTFCSTGTVGTVVWGQLPLQGTIIILR